MTIEFNVDQALQKLGELVEKHGPQAVDLAAQVVQLNAAQNLASAAGLAGVSIGGLFMARWLQGRAQAADADDDFGYRIGVTFSLGVSTVLGVWSLFSFLNIWSWIALFNPKLALAHDVLARLTGIS